MIRIVRRFKQNVRELLCVESNHERRCEPAKPSPRVRRSPRKWHPAHGAPLRGRFSGLRPPLAHRTEESLPKSRGHSFSSSSCSISFAANACSALSRETIFFRSVPRFRGGCCPRCVRPVPPRSGWLQTCADGALWKFRSSSPRRACSAPTPNSSCCRADFPFSILCIACTAASSCPTSPA